MIEKPYIFLSENFAKFIMDDAGKDVSARLTDLTVHSFPFELTFFFTDQWGEFINREVDTLVLRDTNLVNATVYAGDAYGNYTPLFEIADNRENSVFIKLAAPVKTSSLRIVIAAEGNSAFTRLGQVGFYRYLCDLSALTESSFKKDTNQGDYRVLSGAVVYYGDYDKWAAKIRMENLPQSQFDVLTEEIKSVNRLTVVPFRDFAAEEIYECYINPEITYEVNRKTSLYALSLEAQEL
ncbi:MAG: hypothetical protein J6J74_07640 [Elusimicrobiaceae bacterium]|nr:hypothetical protein [Elusimicrobiaceae bacterium]